MQMETPFSLEKPANAMIYLAYSTSENHDYQ